MNTLDIALNFVLTHEGGYSNDPNDPGGRTVYGISERANPDAWRDGPPTREQAIQIYVNKYWKPLDLDKLDNHFAILVFDTAVNMGVGRARGWLDSSPTFHAFYGKRLDFYTRLDGWTHYSRGWTRRMANLMTLLDSLPRTVDVVIDNRPLYKRLLGAFHGETHGVAYRVRLLTRWAGTKMDLEDSNGSH